MAEIRLRPQQGMQEKALACPADIAIIGSSAGVGKTFTLLLDCIRWKKDPNYRGLILRRENKQIKQSGGLWDKSMEVYSTPDAHAIPSLTEWRFSSGAKIKMDGIQYEKDLYNYQGAEVDFIGFDELTHFSRKMFFYMLSRNRGKASFNPYIRATCNPDPESWVKELVSWYLDPVTEKADNNKSGIIRYFVSEGDNLVWGDSKAEVIEKSQFVIDQAKEYGIQPQQMVKSFTFIGGSLNENQILLQTNPDYLGSLMAQDEATQLRLLQGSWAWRPDLLALFSPELVQRALQSSNNSPSQYCLSVDVAGYGQDLAVITGGTKNQIKFIHLFKKTSPDFLKNRIEELRQDYNIKPANVIFDADGLGWGLTGNDYTPFYGGARPLIDQTKDKYRRADYVNLKAQCTYKLVELFKDGVIALDWENIEILIDDLKTRYIQQGTVEKSVKDLLVQDLLSFKRKNPDKDNKKQIQSKSEQKEKLRRSPDIGDSLVMYAYFHLTDNTEWDNVISSLEIV
jgi:hypothetical protein